MHTPTMPRMPNHTLTDVHRCLGCGGWVVPLPPSLGGGGHTTHSLNCEHADASLRDDALQHINN